jgi:hypothetical protein
MFFGAPSLTRGRVCLSYMLVVSLAQSFLGQSPLGLVTIFYCLRFEASLFVASYELQLSWLYYLGTDHIENTVSNSNSIVACVFVTTGTCLPSR